MEIILAIDGGGSRTRCAAIDKRGNILGKGSGGASNHLLVEREVFKKSLSGAIQTSLQQSGLQKTDISCLSAGLAGVDYDGSGADEMKNLFRTIGFENVLVSSDMVIAHAGALAGKPGVLALAGTGSSLFGKDEKGRGVKVGGWGPIYGDEGSAYFIGQSALRAAAKAFDGRGKKTALTKAILKSFGIENFSKTPDLIYAKKIAVRDIAALSRAAYEAAEAGDETARKIFIQAGTDLAEGAAAVVERLSMNDGKILVSYQGSVLKSCLLVRESFREELARLKPRAEVVPPKYEPVIGAYLLGRESLGLQEDEGVFKNLEGQFRGI